MLVQSHHVLATFPQQHLAGRRSVESSILAKNTCLRIDIIRPTAGVQVCLEHRAAFQLETNERLPKLDSI